MIARVRAKMFSRTTGSIANAASLSEIADGVSVV